MSNAQRRQFGDRRSFDGETGHVSLELHQLIVSSRAAIDQ